MKASEYIARIQELMEVVGDVDVIIQKESTYGSWDFFELAEFETQNVIKHPKYPNLWIEGGIDDPNNNGKNIITLLKVW